MDEQRPPASLRGELDALGWSAEQLIARVNQIRARRGSSPLHRKSAYPWLRGRRPCAEAKADVLTTLRQYSGRPVSAADLGWDGSHYRTPRALDTPYDATAVELLHDTQKEAPMHRRSFVLLSGAAVTGPALDLLLGRAGPLRAAQDGDRVTPRLARVVQRTVRQARDLDDSEGSISALLWAAGIWQNLAKILTHSRYHTPEGIRLHTAYIEMSETYGWMLFDAGKHPQAQRVYQTGLRLAREAEDHTDVHRATVNLLASAAYQACWLGQHPEADTLLSVAHSHKSDVLTPRLRAVLADREITLAGALGDTERVHRAEHQAHDYLSAARDGDEPWWSLWLSPQELDANTGSAWLAAHRPDLAEPYLTRRLSVLGDKYPRDRMLFASDLAHARLHTGDITGACEATHHALELSEHVASPRVHERLHSITTALRDRHSAHPRVRVILSQIPHLHSSVV
ncbi:MAG: hypothetical protein ACRDRA_17640 [Pseudonocardiaceae bacterium]